MDQFHLIVTLLILAGTMALLAASRLRGDVVAVLVVLALSVSGVLTVSEALSGFSSTAVIIIACMFVVGKAITHTGIAQHVGEAIIRRGGKNEKKLLMLLMVAACSVGAFMSSSATVAIFIPIALTVAEKAGIHHRRLLMPLAMAAMISGMMTLVATTPNLVINDVLQGQGLSFSFFSITPFGLLNLVLALAFMAFFGQSMLAPEGTQAQRATAPSIDDLLRYYHIDQAEHLLRVPGNSDLEGVSVAQIRLSAEHRVTLLAVQRFKEGGEGYITPARPETILKAEDTLMVIGGEENVRVFAEHFGLQQIKTRKSLRKRFFKAVGVAEVMLNPDSGLIGKTLKESAFQSQFHSMVLALRRDGETLTENLGDQRLKFGDVLLACGTWKDIVALGKHRDQYLLLTLPDEYRDFVPAPAKEGLTLAVLALMVALMVFKLLAPVTAIMAASAALVLLRCVPLSSIYQVVDWQTLVMIAGIMPLALAMQKTGIVGLMSGAFEQHLAEAGPLLILAGLFLVTAALGIFITNTAVAVLMAPVAIEVGLRLGIAPEACAMVVAVACSAAFISPLGSPVNMLVREPGGYSFGDYAKVGLPMLALSLAATLLLCRIVYF